MNNMGLLSKYTTKRFDPNTILPVEAAVEAQKKCVEGFLYGVPAVFQRRLVKPTDGGGSERYAKAMTEQEARFVIIQERLHPFRRASPVRFAMMLKDGSAGSMWKVVARGGGDVYVMPRDILKGTKISLHASGQQHVKVNQTQPSLRMKWKEPFLASPLPASFKLIFTVWSAGMGPTKDYDAARLTTMWEDNPIFIQGEVSENSVITVYFFLTPCGVSVELPPWPPMVRFAVLSVGAGKDLHIIARKERRKNLRVGIERGLAEAVESGGVSACSPIGQQSLLLFGGADVDGCHCLAPVSVEMTEQGVELLRCRRFRVQPPPTVR